MRDTPTLRTVLRAFLDNPRRPRYGRELAACVKTSEANLYRLLGKLNDLQILTSYVENPVTGRPGQPRRLYLMTDFGIREARAMLDSIDYVYEMAE